MMFKYQEVSLQIRQQIEDGIYKKGDRLPSIREMIQQYDCNKDTILKALHLLKEESLIYPVEKSGYYVLKNRVPVRNATKIGLPNPMQFPIEDFRKCLNESVMASYEGASNQREPVRGDRELIEAMVPLLESYGVYAKEDQLSITTGTQQALYILLQLIGTGGLLLEQPTYSRMNQLVKELGLPYQIIEREQTQDTISLEVLEDIFQSGTIRYFYTISRFHNPLGMSYPDSVKKKIVQLAEKYQVYIIEDDYMADYERGTATPLHYFDTNERVIYVKSFSSILFSAFKMGIVVLPNALIKEFEKRKQLLDFDSNLLMQKTLALFIQNGLFEKHRQKMVAHYHEKSQQFRQLLEQSTIEKTTLHGTQLLLENSQLSHLKEQLDSEITIDTLEDAYIEEITPQIVSLDVYALAMKDMQDLIHLLEEGGSR